MRKSGKTASRVDALTKAEWEQLQATLNHPVTQVPFGDSPLYRGEGPLNQARYDYAGRFNDSY